MLNIKNLKYGVGLMLIVMIFLTSCGTTDYEKSCPVFPIGGAKVARELENASYHDFQYTWEWLGRLNKLRQELELCQKQDF